MPFYTFKCSECGKVFESRCTIREKDDRLVACPGCGGRELDRVFGNFSVAVKGQSACKNATPACAENGGCCRGCAHNHQ